MPYGHAGEADGGIAVLLCADAVLGVVEFDERGESQPDVVNDRDGNQAHPPSIEIGVDAFMQFRRIPQRKPPEIMVVPQAA